MEIAERFGGQFPAVLIPTGLTISVDPDQACENIAYARAQNTEVSYQLLPQFQSLTLADANRATR